MDYVIQSLTDWLKEILITGILGNLGDLFADVNRGVDALATGCAASPAIIAPDIFNMIQLVVENAVMPIAGIILTFVACYELIHMVISHNNLANFETWTFFKWIFKTAIAVYLITNTMNITMAVFDVTQTVVNNAGGIISQNTAIDAFQTLDDVKTVLETKEIGELILILIETWVVRYTVCWIVILIFVIIYARSIEVYLRVSLAPIPFATFGSKEQSMMGQNYLKSLFALGFQGLLMMICVGIYAVLIQRITITEDLLGTLWGIIGYTVLLVFTLFKTGSISKAVFNTH